MASLGLAFGMYYNVTRDPEVEADLLEVRDFIFEHYYDPATSRIKDALKYDLSEEIDLGDNGGDITNYLVPGSALLLPNVDLLSDPARRAQFRDDLRVVTEQLIARHRGTGAESSVVLGTNRTRRPVRLWGHRLRSLHQEPRAHPQRERRVPGPAVVGPVRRPGGAPAAGMGRARGAVEPATLRPRRRRHRAGQ